MQTNLQMTTTLQRWILAARPRTLPAAVSPVLIGIGIALGMRAFRPLAAVVILLAAVLIQIGANLVNDVVDFQHGTDTSARLGPLRVTQAGLLTPAQVWQGVIVVFGLAALCGLYLAFVGGPVVIAIGLACILAAWAYSAGPFPMSRYGTGDFFAFAFFGLVAVCGTVFVLSGTLPASAWLGGIGAGVLTTNILVVNNVRDIESDRLAGRTNIPVRFGRKGGEVEYLVMLVIAYLVPAAVVLLKAGPIWALLAYLSLPYAISLFRTFHATHTGRALNRILAKSAQLLLLYSVLSGVGFALAALA